MVFVYKLQSNNFIGSGAMIYKLPVIRYGYDDLEPFIDARTMEIHHTLHHAGYVDKLNKCLEECPRHIQSKSLEDVIADISIVPEEYRQCIRNNGGGHLNHSLFWQIMSPRHKQHPTDSLLDELRQAFDSFDHFKAEFESAALQRFGSGWVWLGLDSHGKLEIVSTPNQDSPIMLGYRPILGIDVWEHAYYLKYQQNRAAYIRAWWNVVDWEKVSELMQLYREGVTHPFSG